MNDLITHTHTHCRSEQITHKDYLCMNVQRMQKSKVQLCSERGREGEREMQMNCSNFYHFRASDISASFLKLSSFLQNCHILKVPCDSNNNNNNNNNNN